MVPFVLALFLTVNAWPNVAPAGAVCETDAGSGRVSN